MESKINNILFNILLLVNPLTIGNKLEKDLIKILQIFFLKKNYFYYNL